MSIDSWKQQYFFLPANAAAKEGHAAALGHSYLKFTGLLPGNLKAHDLILSKGCFTTYSTGEPVVNAKIFGGINCALCKLYLNGDCEGCPIYENSGLSCGVSGSTYVAVLSADRPGPYIKKMLNLMIPKE